MEKPFGFFHRAAFGVERFVLQRAPRFPVCCRPWNRWECGQWEPRISVQELFDFFSKLFLSCYFIDTNDCRFLTRLHWPLEIRTVHAPIHTRTGMRIILMDTHRRRPRPADVVRALCRGRFHTRRPNPADVAPPVQNTDGFAFATGLVPKNATGTPPTQAGTGTHEDRKAYPLIPPRFDPAQTVPISVRIPPRPGTPLRLVHSEQNRPAQRQPGQTKGAEAKNRFITCLLAKRLHLPSLPEPA